MNFIAFSFFYIENTKQLLYYLHIAQGFKEVLALDLLDKSCVQAFIYEGLHWHSERNNFTFIACTGIPYFSFYTIVLSISCQVCIFTSHLSHNLISCMTIYPLSNHSQLKLTLNKMNYTLLFSRVHQQEQGLGSWNSSL